MVVVKDLCWCEGIVAVKDLWWKTCGGGGGVVMKDLWW